MLLLCSVVAVPAHLLQRFSVPLPGKRAEPRILPLEVLELDAVLPDGGLPQGAVIELSAAGSAALATSVALAACRSAQQRGMAHGGEAPWCAFIDPSATLHGPGVARSGVQLERLLIVRPPVEGLSRVALRLVESRVFAVIVVDMAGVPGQALDVPLGAWSRVVRRLSVAAEQSSSSVLLVTDRSAPRPLPLPVALRLELARPAPDQLSVCVAKERRGRITAPRSVAWARPRPKVLRLKSFSPS